VTTPTPPPLPTGNFGGIPPRKLVLGIILAGSILFVMFLLFAGGVAILLEAAPRGHGGVSRAFLGLRHIIAHFLGHRGHRSLGIWL